MTAWRRANPIRTRLQRLRERNPESAEKRRIRALKKLYGITVKQYEMMMCLQGGVCAICGKPPKKKRLSVDHDHVTEAVRGLLCFFCNRRILGRGREKAEIHERAAAYLRRDFDGRKL